MKKAIYLLVFIAAAFFTSCKKDISSAPSATNKSSVSRDTVSNNSGKIFTFAGTGTFGYSGDGGPDTAAQLAAPFGVTVDASGNVYIADSQNERIRKVNTNGIISTIAGNGKAGFSGDGGPATAAEFEFPQGIAVDASGNVYISDYDNQRIRKVNVSGIISTIVGNGTAGYSGDGGTASSAEINNPYGLAIDGSGNLYIADGGNGRIRKVNTSGIISTVAGNGTGGYSGDGGQATIAAIGSVQGVAVDGSGNIYIADFGDNVIRKVNASGIISTVAGNGGLGGYSGDGELATAAELNNPSDVVVDGSGNVYIADQSNLRIRKVNTSDIISTYAGGGSSKGDGGLATAAGINLPQGLGLDNKGNLYIAELYGNDIRIVYK